jgi:hypothetical protein
MKSGGAIMPDLLSQAEYWFRNQHEFLDFLSDLKFDGKDEEYTQLLSRDSNRLTEAIRIVPSLDCTGIIALAIHQERLQNSLTKIRATGGTAIGGNVYDNVADAFFVRCAAHLILGYVPVAFQVTILGNSHWSPYIPMPETVMRRYMDDLQIMNLDKFKASYPAPTYNLEFLQMIA